MASKMVCAMCQKEIVLPHHPYRDLRTVADPARGRQPTDPITGHLHEWCALQAEVKNLMAAVAGANGMAASLLAHAGGLVLLTPRDIARAKELGDEIEVTPRGEGVVEVRLRRQLVMPPRSGLVS